MPLSLLAAAILAAEIIVGRSNGDLAYFPSSANMVLFAACMVALSFVRERFAFYVASFWLVWFAAGSVSMIAANQLGKAQYFLDVAAPNTFFLLAILALVLGIILSESLGRNRQRLTASARPLEPPHPLILGLIYALPFLYVLSVYQGTGDIPLISGRVLSEAMYDVDYGFFHRFSALLTVTILVLLLPLLGPTGKSAPACTFALGMIALTAVAALTDGRRVIAVASALAMMMAYLESVRRHRQYVLVALIAVTGLLTYILVERLRSLGTTDDLLTAWYGPFWVVGVEYRDYVLTFATFAADSLRDAGYDWLASTAASVTPSPLVSLAGWDKQALIEQDSARTLMRMFGINLGVRIGLPGELWFAFHWLALPVITVFGILVGICSRAAANSRTVLGKSILITILTYCALAVMGQSTVTFGVMTTLAYLYILSLVPRLKFKSSSAR